MTADFHSSPFGTAVAVSPAPDTAEVIVVCEHASHHMPQSLKHLGLDEAARQSHIAWDPGALGVARALAKTLQAPLVEGRLSRLIYDLNRPPESPTAIPTRSEIFTVPGNAGLSDQERADRVRHVYAPFRDALASEIAARKGQLELMVTVHSFTPVFNGAPRAVELGLLHGVDDHFAKAMLAQKPQGMTWDTRLNAPYSAADGVVHTLDVHAYPNGMLSVMLEIRNDLIATAAQQNDWAELLAPWLRTTLKEAFA